MQRDKVFDNPQHQAEYEQIVKGYTAQAEAKDKEYWNKVDSYQSTSSSSDSNSGSSSDSGSSGFFTIFIILLLVVGMCGGFSKK